MADWRAIYVFNLSMSMFETFALWAQEVRNLIFKKAATCSHLPVTACGCLWLRGKWLQVAASRCKWLLVAAGQVAASGCGASDCKWRQVAASGCGPSGCLWLKVAASGCKSLQVAACGCGASGFFSRLEVPRNDGILRDNS